MLFLCITLLLGSSLLEEVSSVPLKPIVEGVVAALGTMAATGTPSATPSSSTSVSVSRGVQPSGVPSVGAHVNFVPAASSSPLPKSPDMFAKLVPIPSLADAPTTIPPTKSSVAPSVVASAAPISSALPSNSEADSFTSMVDPQILKGSRSGGGNFRCMPDAPCSWPKGKQAGVICGIFAGSAVVVGGTMYCCCIKNRNK